MLWPRVKIESIRAETRYSLVGGPFGSDLTTVDYLEEGVPVIRGVNLPYDRCFNDEDFVFVREEKADQLIANNAYPGDVVFTQRGTLGQVGVIPIESRYRRYLISQSQMKLTVNSAVADARFVYYFFRHPETVQVIKNHALISGVPHINLGILRDFEIPIPPIESQHRIVAMLSAYDNLIENNRRRMALLEEAARLLYQEWFVRLRFPGHEHTRIVDGVPEGWQIESLGRICASLEDGDWIELKDQGGDDYRLLQISNIGMNDFVETGNLRFISDETFRRLHCREVKRGDILISRMPSPIGRAWYVSDMPWRMVTAVDAAILRADDRVADRFFLTYHLNSPVNIELCERRAVGATRPRISRRELAEVPVLVPPIPLQREFRQVVEPANDLRAILYRHNEKLCVARDQLLPRLMSGEVGVQ